MSRGRQQMALVGRHLCILFGLTLALHLPFVTEAFHMDDVYYLDIARNVFQHPLFPLDLPYVFEGQVVTLWGHTHPPLNSYFIAGMLLLSGGLPSEILLHAVYLVFPLLATISFYFLARRFVRFPLLATAIFATIPALVVMAHTLMTDVPLLALWLCATTLFIYGVDRGDRQLENSAVLTLTAAVFYAYQGLALLPLLAFYAHQRGRLTKRTAAFLCLPVLFLVGWQELGHFHKGTAYVTTLLGYLGKMGLWLPMTKVRTAISTLTYLGGTILFFPFLFIGFGRRWRGLLPLLGLVTGIWLAHEKFASYSSTQKAFFVLCFAGGFSATFWVLLRWLEQRFGKSRDPDIVFLCSWFLAVLLYCIFIFFSGSARYLLPAAPPLVLLLVRATEVQIAVSKRWRAFYVSLLVTQLLLGVALAQADFQFANTFRHVARDFKQQYRTRGDSFLFTGEWGFRYYLGALGGHIMTRASVVEPGELMVESRLCLSQNLDNELNRSLQVVEQRTYRITSPLRLLDKEAKAGFWSDGWGVLPFWFSAQPLDEITVYLVGESP